MIVNISCKTDRFNLSTEQEDFINECCFGEDFSQWLVDALTAAGTNAEVICMEDFGWANWAEHQGIRYLVCVAGLWDGNEARPNYGEWRVMLERRRTLVQKLLGNNRTSTSDPIVGKIVQLLKASGFEGVTVEP